MTKFIPVLLVASKEEINVQDIPCQVLVTGIGPVNAAVSVQKLLDTFDYGNAFCKRVPILINAGTAGTHVKNIPIGEVVLPTTLGHFNFDAKTFEFENLADNMKPLSDVSILKRLSQLEYFYKPKEGCRLAQLPLFSSFIFVNDQNFTQDQYSKITTNFKFFDMEAYFIGKIVKKHKYPFHSLKIISDYADIGSMGWEERAKAQKEKLTQAASAFIEDLEEYYNRF